MVGRDLFDILSGLEFSIASFDTVDDLFLVLVVMMMSTSVLVQGHFVTSS
jgi:hypothetical protein